MKNEFSKVSYGDKESFWIGFSTIEIPYRFVLFLTCLVLCTIIKSGR
jgi:hypothetical protein